MGNEYDVAHSAVASWEINNYDDHLNEGQPHDDDYDQIVMTMRL